MKSIIQFGSNARHILLVLTVSIGSLAMKCSLEAQEQPYTYALESVEWHKGPLPFDAKSGQKLEWAEAPDDTPDVDRWSDESPKRKEDKGVKYEEDVPKAITWWTRPHYIDSQRMFVMEIYSAALGGASSTIRIEAFGGYGYKPRPSDPLGRKGPRIARAQLSAQKKSDFDSIAYKMGEGGIWPTKVDVFVRVGNGSMVNADVVVYRFARRDKK